MNNVVGRSVRAGLLTAESCTLSSDAVLVGRRVNVKGAHLLTAMLAFTYGLPCLLLLAVLLCSAGQASAETGFRMAPKPVDYTVRLASHSKREKNQYRAKESVKESVGEVSK